MVSLDPDMPHHVTQRGNRRQQTFLCDDDYEAYLALMGVELWAYCLMPNHLHLVAVPHGTSKGRRRHVIRYGVPRPRPRDLALAGNTYDKPHTISVIVLDE